MNKQRQCIYLFLLCVGLISCSGPRELSQKGFTETNADVSKIVSKIPDYQSKLQTLRGKGRAIISEPGNTERVTLEFASNHAKSLVTVSSGIGVEGGKLLTDGDTLLVYNKVDKFARKIPIRRGNLDRINRLASLNILNMINYSFSAENVENVKENESLYKLRLATGAEIYVDKSSYRIKRVVQTPESGLPYSKITYDAYASIEGFTLPRRISIFGTEQKSKVALQLTAMNLNPKLENLTINLPVDIPVYQK